MLNKRAEFKKLYETFDALLPKKCGNCASTQHITIHHIVPIVLGGNNTIENLVRLCNECHAKVHDKKSISSSALIKAGIQKRKELGLPIGRPTLNNSIIQHALSLYDDGDHTIKEIILTTGISQGSLYRAINKRKANNNQ